MRSASTSSWISSWIVSARGRIVVSLPPVGVYVAEARTRRRSSIVNSTLRVGALPTDAAMKPASTVVSVAWPRLHGPAGGAALLGREGAAEHRVADVQVADRAEREAVLVGARGVRHQRAADDLAGGPRLDVVQDRLDHLEDTVEVGEVAVTEVAGDEHAVRQERQLDVAAGHRDTDAGDQLGERRDRRLGADVGEQVDRVRARRASPRCRRAGRRTTRRRSRTGSRRTAVPAMSAVSDRSIVDVVGGRCAEVQGDDVVGVEEGQLRSGEATGRQGRRARCPRSC